MQPNTSGFGILCVLTDHRCFFFFLLSFSLLLSFLFCSLALGLCLSFLFICFTRFTTHALHLTLHDPQYTIHNTRSTIPRFLDYFCSSMSLASFQIKSRLNQITTLNGDLPHRSTPQGPSIIHLEPHPPRLWQISGCK